MSLAASLEIRRAGPADAPSLARICRDAFPDSLTWQRASRDTVGWWRAALESGASILDVASRGRDVVGFCLLVLDEETWQAERRLRSAGGVGRRVAGLLATPGGWRALARAASPSGPRPPAPQTGERVDPLPAADRIWLELIAVDPACGRGGIASRLLERAEGHCRDLGRRGIALRVEARNEAALRLYARRGFATTAVQDGSLALTKRLEAVA